MYYLIVSILIVTAFAGPATESYKDQFCTDPRTMKKHAAYTEWADAYSCSRHRCQPGGRNLAIYTVGCKRVEAPESAIECEEVVEDTNMQFPYCCTRLRCLVVVRGEVWTRVLGQPWESLPAAPWSHMYKMKKPPPSDGTFLPKNPEEGPVYELASDKEDREKVLRTKTTDAPDCNEVAPRAAPVPDIVIALSTNEGKDFKKNENSRNPSARHKKQHKTSNSNPYFDEDQPERRGDNDNEDTAVVTEKTPEQPSEERYYGNAYTQKPQSKVHQVAWTDIPQNQWNEHESVVDAENARDNYHQPDFSPQEPEKTEEKQTNLQALVDAIGTRMRDIESVVQKMSQKVHQKPGVEEASSEKRGSDAESHKRHKGEKDHGKPKSPSPEGEHYKRFTVRNRGSKYLHSSTDSTTEQPLFVEDSNLNGYFSDASNSLVRRSNIPKEPAVVYTAPVENARRKTAQAESGEDKKHKKHNHKKRKGKNGKSHKKHRPRDEKKKRFNRVSSIEMLDRNVVSLEDSSEINP